MRVVDVPDVYCERLDEVVSAPGAGAPEFIKTGHRRTKDRVCWAIDKLRELLGITEENGAEPSQPAEIAKRQSA